MKKKLVVLTGAGRQQPRVAPARRVDEGLPGK